MKPTPNSNPGDYAYALEVIAEASQKVLDEQVAKLAHRVINQAESATYQYGVILPIGIVTDAEAITRRAAVTAPREVIKEANAITTYAAEVTELNEDTTEPFDPTIANQAQNYLATELSKKRVREALSRSKSSSLMHSYLRNKYPSNERDDKNL